MPALFRAEARVRPPVPVSRSVDAWLSAVTPVGDASMTLNLYPNSVDELLPVPVP